MGRVRRRSPAAAQGKPGSTAPVPRPSRGIATLPATDGAVPPERDQSSDANLSAAANSGAALPWVREPAVACRRITVRLVPLPPHPRLRAIRCPLLPPPAARPQSQRRPTLQLFCHRRLPLGSPGRRTRSRARRPSKCPRAGPSCSRIPPTHGSSKALPRDRPGHPPEKRIAGSESPRTCGRPRTRSHYLAAVEDHAASGVTLGGPWPSEACRAHMGPMKPFCLGRRRRRHATPPRLC